MLSTLFRDLFCIFFFNTGVPHTQTFYNDLRFFIMFYEFSYTYTLLKTDRQVSRKLKIHVSQLGEPRVLQDTWHIKGATRGLWVC